jgi:hypothetical protein
MSMRRLLVPALTLVLWSSTTLMAQAQNGSGNQADAQPGAAQKLTAERVAVLLNSKATLNNDGSKQVFAVIEKDNWRYEVTFLFLVDGKGWDMYSALGAPGQTFTKAQMDGMAQLNQQWKAQQKYFTVNPKDNRLYLADINFKTDTTEAQFAQSLDNYLATIRNTYDLWKATK